MTRSGFQWRRWQALVVLSACIAFAFIVLYSARGEAKVLHLKPAPPPTVAERPTPGTEGVPLLEPGHPIDQLIADATMAYRATMEKETNSLKDAAAAYRRQRNRHPPPGFDAWHEYATAHGAVMVEDFFDGIYHDLGPHWSITPSELRDSIAGQEHVISVRNGRLDKAEDKRYRVNYWHEMFEKIEHLLPDVDVAFNIMDEPRVHVGYWDMMAHMEIAVTKGIISDDLLEKPVDELLASGKVPISHIKDTFASRDPLVFKAYDFNWTTTGSLWDFYRLTCYPMMPVFSTPQYSDFKPPSIFATDWPFGSLAGYVRNATWGRDPCMHVEIRGLHGTFIEPKSLSTSSKLFPIFGGSRMPGGNDILLPAPRYWSTETKFSGEGLKSFFGTVNDWDKKRNGLFWRGTASGGRTHPDTWTHFQRHRFVSMLNGSQIDAEQRGVSELKNIALPLAKATSDISAFEHGQLPDWVDAVSDAAFTDMECYPPNNEPHCQYTDPWYTLAENVDMYQMYQHKFLPDIDGNSFSGRYRAFLLSSSLPIKATIYSEWHDSRLFAWKHYVPMDNTFVDLYGIMDFFMGFTDRDGIARKRGRDRLAKQMALEGQAWAKRVLRKEDMLIYIYRLVLEFARVTDDDRESLGYVKDLEL